MNQDQIWDYYQNEMPEIFEGSRSRIYYLACRICPAGKVLNIGVGTGIFEEIGRDKGLDIYSLDPNPRSIETLRARLKLGTKAQVGYIQSIPFPSDFFDAVVVSEVFEHLSDEVLKEGLAEIKHVLVRGGRVIGTVPARENLRAQIVVCPECGNRFHGRGHLQSFDLARMRALLLSYFQVEDLLERLFVTWPLLSWKGKIHELAKLLLHRIGIHGSNENIVFIAKKL